MTCNVTGTVHTFPLFLFPLALLLSLGSGGGGSTGGAVTGGLLSSAITDSNTRISRDIYSGMNISYSRLFHDGNFVIFRVVEHHTERNYSTAISSELYEYLEYEIKMFILHLLL